jgi:hypothetical protein
MNWRKGGAGRQGVARPRLPEQTIDADETSEGGEMLIKRGIGTCAVMIAIGATSVVAVDVKGADAKGTVTITGCLQGPLPADDYALSFAPKTPVSTSGAAMTFRLTNVTTKATPASATYIVIGTDKQLSSQLGHQVQIVGTIIKADQPAAAVAAEPTMRVETVRMVSTKCSQRR